MKFTVDNKIPFIKGRLEAAGAEVEYLAPELITAGKLRDTDGLIVRTRTKVDRDLLENTPVRFVATATIGTDHIDLDWCRGHGVAVANAAGCNAPGVAQYVWSTLLLMGFDPAVHTLGLVGKGNVGNIVASWGRLLGAKVLVCDPPRKEAGLADEDYLSLGEVLSVADAVTLHTPLVGGGLHPTLHLIGQRELDLMKKDTILVNSSRGPVVDNAAWERKLAAGGLRAVVDVWEGEPAISRGLLERASYGTPHIAGYSLEGKQRATRMVLEAAGRYFGTVFPTEGLEGPYTMPESLPAGAPDTITASYDIRTDDKALRNAPGDFESLRSNYNLRKEVKF